MKFSIQIVVGLVLVGAAFLVLSAIKTTNIKTVAHKYYYFPLANLYYDSIQKEFLVFDTTAKKWQSVDALPVQKELGKSVFISDPADPVWQNNADHRMTYSIQLYAKSTDVKPPPPKPKVLPADTEQTTPDDGDTQVKKKKGIREFLKRLWEGPGDDKERDSTR